MTIEIVVLPINSTVIFPVRYVSSPEGNPRNNKNIFIANQLDTLQKMDQILCW